METETGTKALAFGKGLEEKEIPSSGENWKITQPVPRFGRERGG